MAQPLAIGNLSTNQATTLLLIVFSSTLFCMLLASSALFYTYIEAWYSKHEVFTKAILSTYIHQEKTAYVVKITLSCMSIIVALIGYANTYIQGQQPVLVAAMAVQILSVLNMSNWIWLDNWSTFFTVIPSTGSVIVSAVAVQAVSGNNGHYGKIPIYAYTLIIIVTEVVAIIATAAELLVRSIRKSKERKVAVRILRKQLVKLGFEKIFSNQCVTPVSIWLGKYAININRNKIWCVYVLICYMTYTYPVVLGLSITSTVDMTGFYYIAMILGVVSYFYVVATAMYIGVAKIISYPSFLNDIQDKINDMCSELDGLLHVENQNFCNFNDKIVQVVVINENFCKKTFAYLAVNIVYHDKQSIHNYFALTNVLNNSHHDITIGEILATERAAWSKIIINSPTILEKEEATLVISAKLLFEAVTKAYEIHIRAI